MCVCVRVCVRIIVTNLCVSIGPIDCGFLLLFCCCCCLLLVYEMYAVSAHPRKGALRPGLL